MAGNSFLLQLQLISVLLISFNIALNKEMIKKIRYYSGKKRRFLFELRQNLKIIQYKSEKKCNFLVHKI